MIKVIVIIEKEREIVGVLLFYFRMTETQNNAF